MVQDQWSNTAQKACVSFNVHSKRRSLCNHHRSLLNTAGGSGDAVSPPAASGQRPCRGAGGEAPGSSENIIFYSTGEGT